jgi:hypothetical protein
MRLRALAAAALALAAGCNPPKYARYESLNKDYTVSVPWGWSVMTEDPGPGFSQANFIGPFDADFYLGAPSLSIRWYAHYRVHRLRDGSLELFSGPDDFYAQMMREVYSDRAVVLGLPGPDGELADGPAELNLKSSGLKAKYFVVMSPMPAPAGARWGVTTQKGSDKPFVLRKHAYAIVPMANGFYVLCYPATRLGYSRYEDRFRALIGSFVPLTAGPGGPKVKLPGPGA